MELWGLPKAFPLPGPDVKDLSGHWRTGLSKRFQPPFESHHSLTVLSLPRFEDYLQNRLRSTLWFGSGYKILV